MTAEFDRASGVGGSDVAAILGLSPWTTRAEVWMEKTRHPHYKAQAQTAAMRWGNILEPVLRAEYMADTGLVVRHDPNETIWAPNGIQYAHLDGWVDPDGIWEGKTGSGDWDRVPVYYEVQVLQYLDLTGRHWCDVSAYLPATQARFHTWRIEQDEIRQLYIRQEIEDFWHDYVLTGQAPPEITDPVILWPNPDTGLYLVADEAQNLDARLLLAAKQNEAAAKAAAAEIQDRLAREIGPAGGMDGDGWYVLYRASAAPQTVGWEAIATGLWNLLESIRREYHGDDPDVIQYLDPTYLDTLKSLYTTTGRPSRPFLIKAGERP